MITPNQRTQCSTNRLRLRCACSALSSAPLMLLMAALSLSSCQYLVDVVRIGTQESYLTGPATKSRLETAAFVGHLIHLQSNASADPLPPYAGTLAARVKEDREYLETSVESCEEILLVASASGQALTNQVLSGVFCNLGPGKRPDQL